MERLTPLKLPVNEIFNTIKDQPWVRPPKLIQHNFSLPESEEYCSHHDYKGYQTVHCWALRRYLEELVQHGFFKEYILTPEVIFRQPNTQPPRKQNLIAQYNAID